MLRNFVRGAFIGCGALLKSSKKLASCNSDGESPPCARPPPTPWDKNWDYRAGQNSASGKNGIVHTILLVRHGQYFQTKEPGDDLTRDSKRILTTKGRDQAIATGQRIQHLLTHNMLPPIDSIYYSTMARATETSQLLTKQLLNLPPSHKILPCSLIRECAVFPPIPAHATWLPSDEDFYKAEKRIEAAFANHVHRPDESADKSYTTLLVCHGNVIRYILLRALQYDVSGWCRLAVYNASVTRIDVYSDGGVCVRTVGDVGHLPADMITYE